MDKKKLRLSQDNKFLAGVCGGIGEFFDVDPTLIRIGTVIILILLSSNILIILSLYLICWAIIPNSNSL